MNRGVLVFAMAVALGIGWLAGQRHAGPAWQGVRQEPESRLSTVGATTGDVVAVRAFFGAGCEKALVDAVDGAEDEVLVAIYSFTRRSISGALARAARRSVKVVVRYDARSADEGRDMPEAIAFLKRSKVRCEPVDFGESRARMHHKFMVVDRKVVLTGSYNYTTAATEQNRENVVVIESTSLAAAYAAEFADLRPPSAATSR